MMAAADTALPLPPADYQPGDTPVDVAEPSEQGANDDASAVEVDPDSESRETAPDAEGSALKPLTVGSAAELELRSTEVLDQAEAELAAMRARVLDPSMYELDAGAKPDLPDNFNAGSVYTDKRGVVYGSGGVSMLLRSLLPQGEARLEADNASFDPDSSIVELSGAVRLSVSGVDFSAIGSLSSGAAGEADSSAGGFDPRYSSASASGSSKGAASLTAGTGRFSFDCDWLSVNTETRELQVRGLRLHLSLVELLGPDAVKELPLRTDFRNHLLPSSPRDLYLSSSTVYFSQNSRRTELVLEQVKISLGARPDPDLFITAETVELGEDQEVILSSVELHISGIDWIRWPRLTRRFKSSPSTFSLDTPQVQVDREFGIAVKEGIAADLGMFKVDALVDYSPEYGVLAKGYAYFEPVLDTQIGVQTGRSTQSNIDRTTVQRRDEYNLIYKSSFSPGGQIEKLKLGAQYGRIHERVPGRPNLGLPDRVAEDTRLMADMDMQLTPLDLGSSVFLLLGTRARYVRYEEHDGHYTVLGGRAGLVWRHNGFDHFVLYRYNNTSGEPLFTFDEVRREQLDFATSVQTLPQLRNVFRGSYDPLAEEFDRLQLGTIKQQKSYEFGVYWDFARESADFEFGLLFD